ncbi:hypothetical protein HaLaN_23922, partial [Haematococcus lacustris]
PSCCRAAPGRWLHAVSHKIEVSEGCLQLWLAPVLAAARLPPQPQQLCTRAEGHGCCGQGGAGLETLAGPAELRAGHTVGHLPLGGGGAAAAVCSPAPADLPRPGTASVTVDGLPPAGKGLEVKGRELVPGRGRLVEKGRAPGCYACALQISHVPN